MNLIAGIDIGGTNTKIGLINYSHEIVSQSSILTQAKESIHDLIADIHSELIKLSEGRTILAIGVGAPNGNYYRGTIEQAPNLKWKSIIPLADLLSQKTSLPVKLSNDANTAALGEKIYGAGKDLDHFISVTLGTGCGSGFISHGHLVYGHDGFAGELGHMIIQPNGRDCNCGRKGCLETYVNISGLIKHVDELLNEAEGKSNLSASDLRNLTPEKLFRLAEKGDLIACQAYDRMARYLAIGLANAVTFSSPSHIFLSGGISQAGDFLMKPLRNYLNDTLLNIFKGKVTVCLSSLKENQAAILGAASLVAHYFTKELHHA